MRHPMLTVKDAGEFLHLHPSTIYRLLKRRVLPAFKVGSDWRFSPEDLLRWVETQPQGQTIPKPVTARVKRKA